MTSLPLGAEIAIKTCLRVKPSETVLVVTDPPLFRIAEILAKATWRVGAEATIIIMRIRTKHGEEPPKPVEYAMRTADVILAPTTYSLSHTKACLRASKAGARIAAMPTITHSMLSRGAMLADYRKVNLLTRKVAVLLDQTHEIKVTSPAGTELTFSVAGRRAHTDTGLLYHSGDFGNLPAGEAFIAPVEGTAEGCVVVDGSMVGTVGGRIELLIEKGLVRKISGGPVRRLNKMLKKAGPKSRNLAEFGIGTNPSARLIGTVLEDEKVLGTCHIALGDNSTFGGRVRAGIHIDGIFLAPTVKLDGKILMENGRLRV